MSGLPMTWTTAPLLKAIELHDSRRIPLNASERAKRKGNYPYYGANGLVDHVDNYIFDGDYVLLAEDGGNFNKPERGVAYEVSGKFWVNNHAHILKPRGEMPPRFLRYWLNAIDWMPYVGGTTHAKLTQAGIAQVSIPIPSLPEQHRIVAELDSLTGRTALARDELGRISKLIRKYREAILVAAFKGQLTREWRSSFPTDKTAERLVARTVEPEKSRGGREATERMIPGVAGLSVNHPGSDVPSGWAWVRLTRIARQETGHTPSRSRPDYWDGGVPWIGIKDANIHHGRVIDQTLQTISDLGLENSSARLLPTGTVCLSRTASVGYVTIMGRSMATSQDFAMWTCAEAPFTKVPDVRIDGRG